MRGKKYLETIINSKRVTFVKGDIRNYSIYSKYLKNVDVAINVAAESHVDNSFKSHYHLHQQIHLVLMYFYLIVYNKSKKNITYKFR